MILLKQMSILFFIMFLGYMTARKGIIDTKVSKSLSWILLNISNPALIISSGLSKTSVQAKEILQVLKIAVLMFFMLILLAEIIIPALHFPKKEQGIYKILMIFSNIGFMGIPVLDALYGKEAVLYASIFCIPFNVLIYTYGVFIISGEKSSYKNIVKKAVNIGTVSSIIAIILTLEKITVWDTIKQTSSLLGNLTAPLSMIIIGASFYGIQVKDLLKDKKLYLFSILKMLVIPLIGLVLIKLTITGEVLQGVSFIMLATPSGSMAVMLAQQYEKNHETAAKNVGFTTLLSIITMPILFLLL